MRKGFICLYVPPSGLLEDVSFGSNFQDYDTSLSHGLDRATY